MKSGMLWLDADARRPFAEKVKRAADYYRDKYGRFPTHCLVNAATLGDERTVDQIVVQSVPTVLPNYFWLGVEAN